MFLERDECRRLLCRRLGIRNPRKLRDVCSPHLQYIDPKMTGVLVVENMRYL